MEQQQVDPRPRWPGRQSHELAWLVALLLVFALAARTRPAPLPRQQGEDVISRYVPAGGGMATLPDPLVHLLAKDLERGYAPATFVVAPDHRGWIVTGPRAKIMEVCRNEHRRPVSVGLPALRSVPAIRMNPMPGSAIEGR